MIFWGEYPLKPDDIGSLPNYLINGEVYGSQFDLAFRAHGIRQMVYTSTEGEEQLFPRYYVRPTPSLLHGADDSRNGRVQDMLDSITFRSTAGLSSTQPGAAQAGEADLTGVFVAGWADAGLHSRNVLVRVRYRSRCGVEPALHECARAAQLFLHAVLRTENRETWGVCTS